MPTVKELRENHIVVSLTMITIVVAGLTAIGTVSGMYNASHTSAAELQLVSDQVDANHLSQQCSTLAIQISLAEQSIWQMNQAGDSSQRLVEKKRDLGNMLKRYDDLHCASILAK